MKDCGMPRTKCHVVGIGSHHHHRRLSRIIRCDAEPPSTPYGSTKKLSKEDMLQKLAAAKEYKSSNNTTTGDPVLDKLNQYASQQAAGESAQFLQAQEQLSQGQAPNSTQQDAREFRTGAGNAVQAANWLQTIATDDTTANLSKDLRPEEFTILKEEAKKAKRVTIETAKSIVTSTRRTTYTEDGYGLAQQQDEAEAAMAEDRRQAQLTAAMESMQLDIESPGESDAIDTTPSTTDTTSPGTALAADATSDDVHKPKVATWGVFPRPRDISQAYGGGRNLRPGQPLESQEAATQRQQRVTAALSSYRKSMGLEIDPEVESQATSLVEEGDVLFKNGLISAALVKYSEATSMVPLRSKLGGRANLQKAICLDSLGRNSDAYTIYKSLEGHTAPGVAKASKRMLFGFKAAENLKVNTMTYGTPSKAWQQYFDRFNSSMWVEYKASKEESEDDKEFARQAMVVAALVCLTPVLLVGALIVKP